MRCDCEMSLAWQGTTNLTSHAKKRMSLWSAWSLVLFGFEPLYVCWVKSFCYGEKVLPMSTGPPGKCKGKKLTPWPTLTAFAWYITLTLLLIGKWKTNILNNLINHVLVLSFSSCPMLAPGHFFFSQITSSWKSTISSFLKCPSVMNCDDSFLLIYSVGWLGSNSAWDRESEYWWEFTKYSKWKIYGNERPYRTKNIFLLSCASLFLPKSTTGPLLCSFFYL